MVYRGHKRLKAFILGRWGSQAAGVRPRVFHTNGQPDAWLALFESLIMSCFSVPEALAI